MKGNDNPPGRNLKAFKHFDKMDEKITRDTNFLEHGDQTIGSEEFDNNSLEQPVVRTLNSKCQVLKQIIVNQKIKMVKSFRMKL